MPIYTPDILFPPKSFHIIAGPSKSGHVTLAFQTIEAWQDGAEWLDCQFEPAKVCIVSAVESAPMLDRHLRKSGLEIPHVSLVRKPRDDQRWSFQGALEAAEAKVSGVEVVLIDGITVFCPKMNDQTMVSEYLVNVNAVCAQFRGTVIGTAPANKYGVDGVQQSPVDRIRGSGDLTVFCASIIFADYVSPKDPENPSRKVHVLPYEEVGRTFAYKFDAGRMIETIPPKEAGSSPLDDWLREWALKEPNVEKRTSEIVEAGEERGMSQRSTERWIESRSGEVGMLLGVRKGVYKPLPIA